MERRSWLKAVAATITSWCLIGNRKTEFVAAPPKEWDDLKDIRTVFKTKLPKDVHASILYVSYVPDMPCHVCVYLELVTNQNEHKAAKIGAAKIGLDVRDFRKLPDKLRESSAANAIRWATEVAARVDYAVDGKLPYAAYIERDGVVKCVGPYWTNGIICRIQQGKVMT